MPLNVYFVFSFSGKNKKIRDTNIGHFTNFNLKKENQGTTENDQGISSMTFGRNHVCQKSSKSFPAKIFITSSGKF